MEETDARLECLRLAAQDARQTGDHSPDKVVKRAHAYADFVLHGKQPAALAKVPQDAAAEGGTVSDIARVVNAARDAGPSTY